MSEDGEHAPDGRESDGFLLGGRYRLIERIGSGTTGTVWRARDEAGERDVAVKEFRLTGDPEDEDHRRGVHRLHHEARAASRVDHPAALAIHEVVVEDGLPWIVMELVQGESLRTALERGPLDPAEAARVGLAVLGALRAAHAVGIVHRDVKPENVLLESGTDRVVLTDFGIGHGPIPGDSLGFVAPEQLSGRGAGPASDLWSLGALLHAAVDHEHERAGSLSALLARLRAQAPEERPGAEEVAAVLEVIAGAPSPTPAPGVVPEPEPEPKPESLRIPAPVPAPGMTPPPRRPLLTALGLLLPKKPGTD
ncbi:serine/threonine-protein kinase [Streptomyces sp. HUAS TT20]|uniref:serine/threonine-protein kinase n=1 Tax=Streptomyces sp. HUAS TT20 TaxID=3447509 RepID=UPI0021D935B9|nr:serine/threonine-protein kinase [Streptomyces sp. HUAS 15-9]UXY29391.1 serine/threonine protein kinase [Streptomyces sp. HUAS 15-9]